VQNQNRKIMDNHKKAVNVIAADVRSFYERKEPFRIYHGATNSTRTSPYRKGRVVDTRSLSNVLEVDRERKTALVEPNVPMDRLVEVTMEHGLVPPVVMELPGITAGGFYTPFFFNIDVMEEFRWLILRYRRICRDIWRKQFLQIRNIRLHYQPDRNSASKWRSSERFPHRES
jgi:hypothetical protein